jgi:hypothetical protein
VLRIRFVEQSRSALHGHSLVTARVRNKRYATPNPAVARQSHGEA